MIYIFNAAILLFCVPVLFLPSVLKRSVIWLASFSAALGMIGMTWALTLAGNFVATHPAFVDTPLQPRLAFVFGEILFLYGVGLFVALVARHYLIGANLIKSR